MAIETEELLAASLSAMRTNLKEKPAWRLAPPPTDDFLLMFLRSEVFNPHKAAERYRKFWNVGPLLKSLSPLGLGQRKWRLLCGGGLSLLPSLHFPSPSVLVAFLLLHFGTVLAFPHNKKIRFGSTHLLLFVFAPERGRTSRKQNQDRDFAYCTTKDSHVLLLSYICWRCRGAPPPAAS